MTCTLLAAPMLYYTLDLLIGFGAPMVLCALRRNGKISGLTWRLFWVGSLIGLSWECPIFLLSAESTALPIIRWVTPLPVHYSVFLIAHTFWDGGLFLAGVWIADRVCDPGWRTRFNPCAMAVMLVWGQLSELAVEISSVLNGGWAYVTGYAWNPVLFRVRGHAITLLPQLIWLAAPALYYVCLIRLVRRNGADVLQSHA